jgi:hypothetical protein
MPLNLPDVSSCLVEGFMRRSAGTLHGVVFDILAARRVERATLRNPRFVHIADNPFA